MNRKEFLKSTFALGVAIVSQIDIKPKSNRIGIWSSEPITTWDHRMYGDGNPYKSKYTWTT